MSETKPDKDIELFKLNQLFEAYRNDYLTGVGFYFTAAIAILVYGLGYSISNYRAWDNLVIFLVIALPVLLIFTVVITVRVSKPYTKKVAYLSNLIKKVERGEPLGDYETMTKYSGD
jgi:uncharacterized membrane protein YesL